MILRVSVTPWHALLCVPRRELSARDELVGRGFQAFCPYEVVPWRKPVNTKRGRAEGKTEVVQVERALFSPYIFVNTDDYDGLAQQRKMGRLQSVGDFVRVCGKPVVIPARQMAALQRLSGQDGLVGKVQKAASVGLVVGAEFKIADGVFKDFMGKVSSLARLDSTGCLTAWVSLFGRVTEVELPIEQVGRVAA
jgi:transcription antitermination factor NusG